jgi:hypothetical protein
MKLPALWIALSFAGGIAVAATGAPSLPRLFFGIALGLFAVAALVSLRNGARRGFFPSSSGDCWESWPRLWNEALRNRRMLASKWIAVNWTPPHRPRRRGQRVERRKVPEGPVVRRSEQWSAGTPVARLAPSGRNWKRGQRYLAACFFFIAA